MIERRKALFGIGGGGAAKEDNYQPSFDDKREARRNQTSKSMGRIMDP